MGTLYLVATPIGNLEDMTLRAIRVLGEVSLVAAEDTRAAKVLLDAHGVRARRITSYNDHNRPAKTGAIIDALAEADVALVTDAGMPGISDPGHALVLAAVEAGHRVVALPGASAVIAAVAASGLPARRFHYLGFLPKASGQRRRAIAEAASSGDTLVVYESPHRLRAMLADAGAVLGDNRSIAVCRELTKRYEEIWRGTVADALAHFASPRGEFTVVIEGGEGVPADGAAGTPNIDSAIAELLAGGATSKDAVASLMKGFGLKRREAYRTWAEAARDQSS
jgi:16S rRNA (cytidine1402-2'-O)-methyltransferase